MFVLTVEQLLGLLDIFLDESVHYLDVSNATRQIKTERKPSVYLRSGNVCF